MDLGLSTLIGSGLSFLGGTISNAVNSRIANQNLNLQREINSQNIAFQQRENDLTRAREDNAIQRAAMDMQASGLSKTLAAGHPASASSLTAPQSQMIANQFKYESAMQKMNILDALQTMASKQKSIENETNLTNSQVDKNEAEAENIRADTVFTNIKAELESKLSPIKVQSLMQNLENDKATYKKILADTSLTEKERDKRIQEISNLIAQREHINAETAKLYADLVTESLKQESLRIHNETDQWNLDYYRNLGYPTGFTGGMFGQMAQSISGPINHLLNLIFPSW